MATGERIGGDRLSHRVKMLFKGATHNNTFKAKIKRKFFVGQVLLAIARGCGVCRFLHRPVRGNRQVELSAPPDNKELHSLPDRIPTQTAIARLFGRIGSIGKIFLQALPTDKQSVALVQTKFGDSVNNLGRRQSGKVSAKLG
ncbi:hypothetical protein [Microcoleus vaginatus]|uniref:hypothetical protein n=2 Tax=Microcoleus vaginatus TaxID=119532 RepID=UPI0040409A73